MSAKKRVTVLGDGGWGTALALVNARHDHDVLLWSAFPDYAKVLEKKRENIKFLPGVELPRNIQIETDLKKAIQFSDIIVLAIPTQYLRKILIQIKCVLIHFHIFKSK